MRILTGDLLKVLEGTILHQVNCRGVVGGLAGALAAKHPMAFVDYFLLCEKYEIENLGAIAEGHVNARLSIFHIFGQGDPGPNTDLQAVMLALGSLRRRPHLKPIYIPHGMGCGIGGASWPEYSALLERFLPDATVILLPQAALT